MRHVRNELEFTPPPKAAKRALSTEVSTSPGSEGQIPQITPASSSGSLELTEELAEERKEDLPPRQLDWQCALGPDTVVDLTGEDEPVKEPVKEAVQEIVPKEAVKESVEETVQEIVPPKEAVQEPVPKEAVKEPLEETVQEIVPKEAMPKEAVQEAVPKEAVPKEAVKPVEETVQEIVEVPEVTEDRDDIRKRHCSSDEGICHPPEGEPDASGDFAEGPKEAVPEPVPKEAVKLLIQSAHRVALKPRPVRTAVKPMAKQECWNGRMVALCKKSLKKPRRQQQLQASSDDEDDYLAKFVSRKDGMIHLFDPEDTLLDIESHDALSYVG